MIKKILIIMLVALLPIGAMALDEAATRSVNEILQEVYKDDQELRQVIAEKYQTLLHGDPELQSLWKKQIAQDEKNQKIVSEILDHHGWPTAINYSYHSNSDIVFLVIQHASLEYQLKYFALVEEAVESGNLQPSAFALLQDRVLIGQGKEQIYGSQLKTDPDTGENTFSPIADEEFVNERRAKVGLEPIEEYAKHFDTTYKWQK